MWSLEAEGPSPRVSAGCERGHCHLREAGPLMAPTSRPAGGPAQMKLNVSWKET